MKQTFFILLAMCGSIFLLKNCNPGSDVMIMTVNGPVPASEMGITLVHEHVLVDFIGADSSGYHRWDKSEVVDIVSPHLSAIKDLNVQTLIECTPAFVGRDPVLLKMLSDETGLQLVTNTGYYGAYDNKYIPASFYALSAEELAALWIAEYDNGIEGSGIRPGFIKISVNDSDTLSPDHIKIITAAALAHQKTGLVIASHTGPDKPAFEQLQVLDAHGIDPSAFIWVHAQGGTLEGNIRAAQSGCWISLDNVNAGREPGTPFDVEWYAQRIDALKKAGLLNRVLISHDAGWYSAGEPGGGDFRGFTGIIETLLPALKDKGFTQKELDQLLITNPREAFSIR